MELRGRVEDLDLAAVLRLLKLSRKSGVLRVQAGRRLGSIAFHEGQIYYAALEQAGWPLGSRLLKWGMLTSQQLAAIQAVDGRLDGYPLASNILRRQLLDEDEIGRLLADQVAEAMFQMLGWETAEYSFEPLGVEVGELLAHRFDPEVAGLEAMRRVDEWSVVLSTIGSLQKVPHLRPGCPEAEVRLTRDEWRLLASVDGRRDVLTIIEESGLGRFATGKLLAGMVQAGLVAVKDPALELLGQSVAVAVRGPIDIYNAMFLASAGTGELTDHRRLEQTGDDEVEVRIVAGVRDRGAAGTCLIYSPDSRTPAGVMKRLALETSAFVVLVNINSRDAVSASRDDVELMRVIGDRPFVVATYASLADEMVEEAQVRELLQLDPGTPVINSGLRDADKTGEVIERVIAMVP
jgi:hypothetical protein